MLRLMMLLRPTLLTPTCFPPMFVLRRKVLLNRFNLHVVDCCRDYTSAFAFRNAAASFFVADISFEKKSITTLCGHKCCILICLLCALNNYCSFAGTPRHILAFILSVVMHATIHYHTYVLLITIQYSPHRVSSSKKCI
jgi:hypothetical protein